MAAVSPPQADPKMFDNPYGRMALKLAPFTEASDAAVMVHLLAGASAMATGRPRIITASGAMPLGFWPVIVGLSGKGRKGTAWQLSLSVMHQAAENFFESHVQYGFETGLGVMQALSENVDPNTGKLAPMLIVEEEMSKFIDAGKKDRRLGAALTKAFDGRPITYKTGKDDIRIPNPHIAFVGHVQPKLWNATRGSKDAAGGTWNRFVLCWSERSKRVKMFETREGREDAIAECAEAFSLSASYGRERSAITVPLKVADVFEKVHRPIVEDLVNQSEEISEFAERAMAYLLRVAALYALAERRTEVSVKNFDSALELVKYSVATLTYLLSGNRSFTGRTTFAEKVLAFVKAHGPCTYTILRNKIGGHNDKSMFVEAFRELDGQVILFRPPRKPGQRGNPGLWVCTPEQRFPEGSELVDLDEEFPEEDQEQGETAHRNYQTPEAQDDPQVVVEAEVIKESPANGQSPEKPVEPLKALPSPKPAKRPVKPSVARTEPPKGTQARMRVHQGGHKVTPTPTPVPAKADDPDSWF